MKLEDRGMQVLTVRSRGDVVGAAAVVAPLSAYLVAMGASSALAAMAASRRRTEMRDGILHAAALAEPLTKTRVKGYLGRGGFGSAFETEDGRVLKITLDPSEANFAEYAFKTKDPDMVRVTVAPRELPLHGHERAWVYVREMTKNLRGHDLDALGLISKSDGTKIDLWTRFADPNWNDIGRSLHAVRTSPLADNINTRIAKKALDAGYVAGDMGRDNFGKTADGRIVARDIEFEDASRALEFDAWRRKAA